MRQIKIKNDTSKTKISQVKNSNEVGENSNQADRFEKERRRLKRNKDKKKKSKRSNSSIHWIFFFLIIIFKNIFLKIVA